MKIAIFTIVVIAMIQSTLSMGMSVMRRTSSLRIPMRSLSMGVGAAVDTKVPEKLNGKTSGSKLIGKTDCFIFDCDGVIWKGDRVIDGVPDVLAKLRAAGKKIFFVTNNSTKSRKGYLGKFQKLGLDVQAEEIFSSSFAAAAYLEQNPLPTGKKVYVIGQEGIGQELDLLNIPYFGGPDDSEKVFYRLTEARFSETGSVLTLPKPFVFSTLL